MIEKFDDVGHDILKSPRREPMIWNSFNDIYTIIIVILKRMN